MFFKRKPARPTDIWQLFDWFSDRIYDAANVRYVMEYHANDPGSKSAEFLLASMEYSGINPTAAERADIAKIGADWGLPEAMWNFWDFEFVPLAEGLASIEEDLVLEFDIKVLSDLHNYRIQKGPNATLSEAMVLNGYWDFTSYRRRVRRRRREPLPL